MISGCGIGERVRHVRVYATDRYGMGLSAARSSGARAMVMIKALSRWGRRNPHECGNIMRAARAGKTLPGSARSAVRGEVEGLAAGLGLDREDVFFARAIAQSLVQPQCTNFGAVPPATAGGDVMVSWNLDAPLFLKLLLGRFPFYVREMEGSIPYLCLGVPALFGIGVLNAEGLCSVVNAVGIRDDGEGMSPFELNNLAMETCRTVEEAARLYEDSPRQAIRAMTIGMLMNWNTMWADDYGHLSVFEYSHSHFHEQPVAKEGAMASANHHQFLDRSLSGSFDPGEQEAIAGSYSRLSRMWALLGGHHGKLDPMVWKSMVSDHLPDYRETSRFGISREWWEDKVDDSTICAHAWNWRKHLARREFSQAFLESSLSCTLYSLLIQPRSHTVWFTNGHPCRNPARPFYWGRVLGVAESATPSADAPARVETATGPAGIFRVGARPHEMILSRAWYAFVESIERKNFREL